MTYLLTQIALYMSVTFLLGLLIGWLIWRYGRDTAVADTSTLEAERDELRAARDRLTEERDVLQEQLSNENNNVATLKAELERCHTRCRELEDHADESTQEPAVAAPVMSAQFAEQPKADVGVKPDGIDGPRGGVPDDLQRISGVGPKLEKLLHNLGFYHFDQIANWTEEHVVWVDQNLEGFYGRVTRDRWIEQAKSIVANSPPS